MAVHPTLRRPIDAWVAQVVSWMRDPGIQGSILTSIAFDYRRVAGDLDVDARLDALVPTIAGSHPIYLRHLAARALDHRPPTGFVRDFVVERHGENAGRLDVKHGGIQIVTSLGRLWALRGGRSEKRTLARLQAAVETGQIQEAAAHALDESFRLLWQIRLDHQAAQVRAGEPPDDFVDPSSIGPIARRGLKEAFRIIEREQRGVGLEFGLG
jgi:CBS domain-containing protein